MIESRVMKLRAVLHGALGSSWRLVKANGSPRESPLATSKSQLKRMAWSIIYHETLILYEQLMLLLSL